MESVAALVKSMFRDSSSQVTSSRGAIFQKSDSIRKTDFAFRLSTMLHLMGGITIDETFTVLISTKLKRYLPSAALEHNFSRFEGTRIRLPEKVAEPNPTFLRYHHKNIFQK